MCWERVREAIERIFNGSSEATTTLGDPDLIGREATLLGDETILIGADTITT